MKKLAVTGSCLLCVLVLSGCMRSTTRLDALSAAGTIQQDAPVKAHVQIQISAPPDRVWALLIDAASWPNWYSDIESVEAPAALATGTRFTWKSGSTTVRSEVHLFEPEHCLSWTGMAFPAKAVHVWELEATPGGGTLVTVNESMEGPLLKWLYPSTKLAEADMDWLAALKHAAEQKP
jgi:uncharacterized protein YndB with AHSA1/START domain